MISTTCNNLVKYLVAGDAGRELAKQLSELSGWPLLRTLTKVFPDGEGYLRFLDIPHEGSEVIVVQSTNQPQETNLFQLLNIVSSLKEYNVRTITAIVPYLAYARADRVVLDGDAVSARTVLQLLEKIGIDKLVCIDVHEPEIFNFTNMETYNLIPANSILQYFKNRYSITSDWKIYAPDAGARDRARVVAETFGIEYSWMLKERNPTTGEVATSLREGEVLPSTLILVDDIMSSGQSLINAMSLLRIKGVETIHVVISHVMGTGAVDQLREIGQGEVIATQSVPSNISNINFTQELLEVIK